MAQMTISRDTNENTEIHELTAFDLSVGCVC